MEGFLYDCNIKISKEVIIILQQIQTKNIRVITEVDYFSTFVMTLYMDALRQNLNELLPIYSVLLHTGYNHCNFIIYFFWQTTLVNATD